MAQLIRFADCVPVPWKNGTGTTRELWKRVGDDGQILARISAAEISGAQAFSNFAGYDRVILQLAGPQVVLTIDGKDLGMDPATPIAFAGEARAASRVGGKALDLNLMCLRSTFRPAMRVVEVHPGASLTGHALLALQPVALRGALNATLQIHDLLVLERGEAVVPAHAARLVVMDIHPAAAA